MTDREKIIELLNEAHDAFYANYVPMKSYMGSLADCLIANGRRLERKQATSDKTSEWISEEERLPTQEGWYLVFTTPNRGYKSINKGYFCKGYDWDNFTPRWHGAGGTWKNVTHWMPLPEPPVEV